MEDVAPALLKKIQEQFVKLHNKSNTLKKLYKKIEDGKATYKEANEYAIEVGEILAKCFKDNLSSSVLPDGRMYYNIAKRILTPTMQNNYDLITNVTSQIQTLLNKRANIGIKVIVPELNKDRVSGIINKVSQAPKYDEVAWVLDEPIVNFSQSIVDDSIRVNADFHAKAGMSPKIIRSSTGKCCSWCKSIAGVWEYEKVKDTGNNVFRRHNRCRCVVEYMTEDGKVQDVHTKKTTDEKDIKSRIENSRAYQQRMELEAEQRKEKLKNIGLMSEEEKEALKFKRTFEEVPQNRVVNVMRKDSRNWIKSLSKEEIRCIQKYTLNEVEEKVKFYERLNAMLRGDWPKNDNLVYYAETISNALKKSTLGENIKCYRGSDVNPIGSATIGQLVRLNQFISTSIKKDNAFNKKVEIIIYAKKGNIGAAYVEGISKKPKQREVIFDKDCIYRVLSNQGNIIELEVG